MHIRSPNCVKRFILSPKHDTQVSEAHVACHAGKHIKKPCNFFHLNFRVFSLIPSLPPLLRQGRSEHAAKSAGHQPSPPDSSPPGPSTLVPPAPGRESVCISHCSTRSTTCRLEATPSPRTPSEAPASNRFLQYPTRREIWGPIPVISAATEGALGSGGASSGNR
jgi:hypothetical protein